MAITWSPTRLITGEAAPGLSNGNLTASYTGTYGHMATVGKSSGKWYFELVTAATTNAVLGVGVATLSFNQLGSFGTGSSSATWRGDGELISGGVSLGSAGETPGGAVVGIAFDVATRRIWFAKNNVWVLSGDPANNVNPSLDNHPRDGLIYFPACQPYPSTVTAQFSSDSLTYSPPSGFSVLTEPSDWDGVYRGRATTVTLRADTEYGGTYRIIEPITRLNTVPPQPRRVRLCDQRSGRLVREQWSDPTTGNVDFQYLRAGPWVLYALDHTHEHEAVAISDRLATADGSRP